MLFGDALPEVKLPNGEMVNGITIRRRNPVKTAVVRLPLDRELLDHMGKARFVYHDLGRRNGTSDIVPNPKADLALFDAIRVDGGGDEFDQYEAADAITKITSVRVLDCEASGTEYRIRMETPFGETVIVLGEPTAKALQDYRRNISHSIEKPHGREERRLSPEVAMALYDAVAVSVEGYAPSMSAKQIPPNHKQAAVVELVQTINQLDQLIDPNS